MKMQKEVRTMKKLTAFRDKIYEIGGKHPLVTCVISFITMPVSLILLVSAFTAIITYPAYMLGFI